MTTTDNQTIKLYQLNKNLVEKLEQSSVIKKGDFILEEDDQILNITLLTDFLLKEAIQYSNVKVLNQNNEMSVIGGLNILLELTQSMTLYSQQLHQGNQPFSGGQCSASRYSNLNTGGNVNNSIGNRLRMQPSATTTRSAYPLKLYKSFRTMYNLVQGLSNTLNEFKSSNQQFLKKKDDLINQQLLLIQSLSVEPLPQNFSAADSQFSSKQSQQNTYQQRNQKDQNNQNNQMNQYQQQQQQLMISLQQQILNLQDTLRRNDDQYSAQIQRYNNAMDQMALTIETYQEELKKITHYEYKLADMESRLIRFRQEKYRNEIIIDNMAKKIRNYERQVMGPRTFLSPQSSSRRY